MAELYPTGEGGYKAKDFDEAGVIYENEWCMDHAFGIHQYTREDFLRIAKGHRALARAIFAVVSWEHPETTLDQFDADDFEAVGLTSEEFEAMPEIT